MNSFPKLVVSLLLVAAVTFMAGDRGSTSAMAASSSSAQAPGQYAVDVQVSSVPEGTAWRYTIAKTKPDTKDLGHFIINFGNCGDQSPTITNVISAKVNGVDWRDQLESTEGRTGCNIDSVKLVKFDNLPPANIYVIEFTLDGTYPLMDSSGWLKHGTTCERIAMLAPGCKGYTRTTAMDADASLVGKLSGDINTYMRQFGFDYTENPNCTGGYGGDINGVHGEVGPNLDSFLNKYVFRFNIHIAPVIDGDRCSATTVDRQRNEMKSITNNSTWAKVQGNYDEWQILEWKFKLPAGFQPTQNFTHIHQLKGQDGPNIGSPVITITPRANSDGSNRRIQVIHSVDGADTGKGTIVDNIPLSDFEDQWVQVREEVHYTHDGYYGVKITRISDGKVLVDFKDNDIDMWRIGTSYIRSKWGIYRSLGNGRLNKVPVGPNPLLKNESLWISDFRIYEKNTNPDPGSPHE